MKKKNHEELDLKTTALVSFTIGVLLLICIVLLSFCESGYGTVQEITNEMPYVAMYFVTSVLILMALVFIVFLLFRYVNYNELKKAIRIKADILSERIATKNSNYIYCCLQVFLCDVIKRNNETLKLSVSDVSSLIPKGYTISCKNNCVFYRFEIVTPPRRLDYDCNTYKSILNGFIGKELYCYGIQGLKPSFQNTPSVFIDRLFYNSNTLTIDILFIDNQSSYLYFQKAVERDRKLLKNEEAVKRLLMLLKNR